MKRVILGIFAVAFALVLNSFTSAKVTTPEPGKQTLNWYPVDRTSQVTTSTTPVVLSATQAAAINAQPCKNIPLKPVCLVGATSAPALHTPASSFGSAQQILFTN